MVAIVTGAGAWIWGEELGWTRRWQRLQVGRFFVKARHVSRLGQIPDVRSDVRR